MPKEGFKSITVTDLVYDTFFDTYKLNKKELHMQGVHSFSGYITDLLEKSTKRNIIFSKYQEKIQKISVSEERIILQDTRINRVVEITIDKEQLYCHLCEKSTCSHVGYCYSIHNIYKNLSK